MNAMLKDFPFKMNKRNTNTSHELIPICFNCFILLLLWNYESTNFGGLLGLKLRKIEQRQCISPTSSLHNFKIMNHFKEACKEY